jgi:prolyl oligopeptidase
MKNSLCKGLMVLFAINIQSNTTQGLNYPASRMEDVVDTYHGVSVADPYRWLEDATSQETRQWTDLQNQVTEDYLKTIPAGETIRARLTKLWNYAKYSTPEKIGDRYFFWKNDGLQNQSVLYALTTLDDQPRQILNPNTMSDDGTLAISGCFASHDGTLLAYATSSHGSDWSEIKIRQVDTGQEYDEVLKWCKFPKIAWKHDNSGFFYNRLAQDDSLHSSVYWHQLGTPQSQDVFVFECPIDASFIPYSTITEDGKFLILQCYRAATNNCGVYYRPVDGQDAFTKLFDADASHQFVGNNGSTFYFLTNDNAPRSRLVSLDVSSKNLVIEEVIAQQPDNLESACIINNQLVCGYMHDAYHQLKIYNLDGTFDCDITLPTLGSISQCSGQQDDKELFIDFTSFLYPSTIFRYDFALGQLQPLWIPDVDVDASLYETKQIFYPSKDGTRVPMFITHKKNIKLDGNNPTIVYGYGGFEVSMTPSFSVSVIDWLDHGGIFVVANIRGGGEYGAEWHEAAKLDKRQVAFDDFIAASQWLIANQYTQSSRLAIMGGSNGGLLVAACMLQRPELFGAVVCQVPVADMLRYHKFTLGRYWVPEYGNAETSEAAFKSLYAYSPLHNVKAGICYPPILVTTADTDDRVVPLHSKKFIATLQAAGGKNYMLLRVDTKAGHGAGKPTAKQISEKTDIYSFLYDVFKMT